nr:hypothetical protein [Pseudomonas mosselii]
MLELLNDRYCNRAALMSSQMPMDKMARAGATKLTAAGASD